MGWFSWRCSSASSAGPDGRVFSSGADIVGLTLIDPRAVPLVRVKMCEVGRRDRARQEMAWNAVGTGWLQDAVVMVVPDPDISFACVKFKVSRFASWTPQDGQLPFAAVSSCQYCTVTRRSHAD